MKKVLLLIFVLLMIATGCKKEDANNPPPTETEAQNPTEQQDNSIQGTVAEYFPIKENSLYIYTGSVESANQETYPIFIEGNKLQRRTSAGGFISTEILSVENSEVKLIYTNATSNGFENFLNKANPAEVVILKEPLQLNATWERNFVSNDSTAGEFKGTSKITDVNVSVTTPAGEFETLVVTTEFETGNLDVEYYAKGIGLVKREYINITRTEKGQELSRETVTVELSEIKEDTACEFEFTVYYPDDQVNGLLSETRKFQLKTNEDIRPLLEGMLKKPSEGPSSPIITENTKINTISVDSEASEVHLDLSKEFVDEMNAGSGYEALIQESLKNIFTDFYRASSLKLTIEGEDYIPKH
ncbi:MAG: hypothetical protein E7234_01525 [Lachnospiraceae bacterium]|nr:hypothetical protein [Lachnospiraceae bacterium]